MMEPRRHGGFTLIELMVTLTILALLASVAVPITRITATRSREAELQRSLAQIRSALDQYKVAADAGHISKSIDDSGYPASLFVLAEGVVDAKDPAGERLYFLRRVPRDPMCACPELRNEETWGVRSYASSADDPQEGRDVFDVYSRSPSAGLDSRPYRDW
ncbi:type II secretion system protein [Pararobbsia alpina]|uniref:Type II secretion system protein G n=1 Tax=Pararobbsia alpina TaxID=621374 RepID=A0A6S7ASD5_9BURK|nr:type II secretion system protein [Pararobbsia alpina]CAB3776239.1 hypothetical protein LMG28138_00110 [Pararobbsia alpina]